MGNPLVQRELNVLRAKSQENVRVTVESLTAELEEARQMAIQQHQAGAMTQAVMGKAKLHGLLVEDRLNDRDPYEGLTAEEIAAKRHELERQLEEQQQKLKIVGGKAA